MTERIINDSQIEGLLTPNDQLIQCPHGHNILISRYQFNCESETEVVRVSAPPWKLIGRRIVGVTTISAAQVMVESKPFQITCPSCPKGEGTFVRIPRVVLTKSTS